VIEKTKVETLAENGLPSTGEMGQILFMRRHRPLEKIGEDRADA
jgi:hypothetical protein